jgi:uncharacterized protein (TIGR02594 family)
MSMLNKQVSKVQNALFIRGFLVGEVDGVWGRRTIAALKSFQTAEGLNPDGIFGPRTAAKLFPFNGDARDEPLLPWMAEAQNLKGLKEYPGPGTNSELIRIADELGIDYASDDIAWCGLFVAHCIGATLPDEPLPSAPLRARSWAKFGAATAPRVGAVMVFWRETPTSGKGHVAFYVSETPTQYVVLGGNQGDSVNETAYSKERFISARWPITAGPLGGGRAIVQSEIIQPAATLSDAKTQASAAH